MPKAHGSVGGRAVLLSNGGSLSLTAEEPGLECKAFFTLFIGAEHLRIHENLPYIVATCYVLGLCTRNVKFKEVSLWIVYCGSAFKFHLEYDISIL